MTDSVEDYNALRLATSAALAPEWTFADRLRKARKLAGMTQREFALAIGFKAGTLSSWEAENSSPSRGDMLLASIRIQTAAGIPAWWTLGQAEPHDLLNDETADRLTRTAARELLEAEMLEGASVQLPHLDSNQEPSDYRTAQIRALPGRHLALVRAS